MAQPVDVKFTGKDLLTPILNGIEGKLDQFRISIETNNKGINKLDNSLRGLGAQAAQLPGPMGRLFDSLIEFAPGGLIGAGVVAGVGGIVMALDHQKKKQEELAKLQTDNKKTLEDVRLSYVRLTEGVEAYNQALLQSTVAIARNELTAATQELTNYFNELDAKARAAAATMVTGAGFAGEEGGAATRGIQQLSLEERIQAQRQRLLESTAAKRIELEGKVGKAVAALNNGLAAKQEDAANKEKQATTDAAAERQKQLQKDFSDFSQLFDLQQSGIALSAERQQRLNELQNQYADVLNNINAPLDALNFAKKAEEIVAKVITEEYEKQLKLQKEIADAEKKRLEESGKAAEQAAKNALTNLRDEDALLKQNFMNAAGLTNEYTDRFKQALATARAELALAQAEGVAGPILEAQKKLDDLETTAVEKMKSGLGFEAIAIGANAIADGFGAMFDAIASGENAFKAFGKAAKQAVAQSLQILGREQLVKGLSNLASGFAAAALGPIGGKSASEFFKAAGFNFAAASLAGAGAAAFGGSGGAGGVGGGGFSNSQLGRNNFNTQQPTTIIIQGGSLLDMNDPTTQRTFISAIETVSNRRIKFSTMGA